MNRYFLRLCLWLVLCVASLAVADPKSLRWTGLDDSNAEFSHVLDVIRAKSGIALTTSDFMPLENRDLANNHFAMFEQAAGGIPIRSQSVRIWTSLKTGAVVQVEAFIDEPPMAHGWSARAVEGVLSSQQTMALVRQAIKSNTDDPYVRSVNWRDYWDKGSLVRIVKVKGKRGATTFTISVSNRRIIDQDYREFPQADQPAEFSIPVRVYPIYEEVEEGTTGILPRIESELRHLFTKAHRVNENPYIPLLAQRYDFDLFDPFLGLTVAGQKEGYWTMSVIKSKAAALLANVTPTDNGFQSGVILEGRYATVSIHPDAAKAFQKLNFTPKLSGQLIPLFQVMPDKPGHEEMIPSASLLGRPIVSLEDAWNRPARRLPDHDPSSYINDGFDELQVYWGVNQLFESLRAMGFTDPELSTRPFNAFLYNPDIEYRDNAFYTDDTINFTTYSPKASNFARDNTTIWHELGHGVMDRLMGDFIQLADTGGLSEGMADFVAQLVVNDVVGDTSFPGKEKMRIFNNTGFYLTNEVHDDGEAYGGTMNDLLRAALAQYGRPGLVKVTDLTLETMRLTRNHPALTANDWFDHMLFADELGSAVRSPKELSALILQSLGGRNFVFGTATPATFTLKNGDDILTSNGPGSRIKPIPLSLGATETASFNLEASLKGSAAYSFKYPVTVKVEFRAGALQGAIHWIGKETGPWTYTLASENDKISIPLKALGKCDEINRPDGSCVDYAYVQIWNQGETVKPQAKKRFYLKIMTK